MHTTSLLTANIFESGPMPTRVHEVLTFAQIHVHEVLRIFIFCPPKEI